jgi:hypothetical protein
MIEKLNLPIVKKSVAHSKSLSMNDYLKFVNLHLKYTFNKETTRKWKKKLAVNVPFVF